MSYVESYREIERNVPTHVILRQTLDTIDDIVRKDAFTGFVMSFSLSLAGLGIIDALAQDNPYRAGLLSLTVLGGAAGLVASTYNDAKFYVINEVYKLRNGKR